MTTTQTAETTWQPSRSSNAWHGVMANGWTLTVTPSGFAGGYAVPRVLGSVYDAAGEEVARAVVGTMVYRPEEAKAAVEAMAAAAEAGRPVPHSYNASWR